ncbi:NIPSNAP family protein [Bosea sp. LjRoot90]|uniref:NIPSNAP family protein n=1 Tax=Bosea sp. LjRoot90 TaxID=3342342 RepID=UPI003ED0BF37
MTDTVFELRRYTLKPGAREALIDVFDTHLVETQEAVGMNVVCQFRDPAAPDQFVWFRGFADQEARTRSLPAFYDGSVWAEHGPAANETMLEWHDVLMLKPATPGSGLDTSSLERLPPGTADLDDGRNYIVAIHHLAPEAADVEATVAAKAIADAVGSTGGAVIASLISDRSENDFKQLPVREGECVAVTLARPAVAQAIPALEAALRAVPIGSSRVPDIARLVPTARSLLR